MIAAFMFGSVTRHSRCQAVAPSTLAASCSSSGTCTSPASSSSEMNGVVFQISDRHDDEQRRPALAEPVEVAEAEPLVDEAGVELERVAPDERRDDGDDAVGDRGSPCARATRPRMMRYITKAKPNPSTSSTATLTTVMSSVVHEVVPPHRVGQDRPVVAQPDELRPAGSVSR